MAELKAFLAKYPNRWHSFSKDVITSAKIHKDVLEKVKRILRAEVQTYDDYLQGNVYGYKVTSPDGRDLDSCWGFYPDHPIPWTFEKSIAFMLDEAKSAINYDIRQEKEGEMSVQRSFAL